MSEQRAVKRFRRPTGSVNTKLREGKKWYVAIAWYTDPTTNKRRSVEAWRTRKSEAKDVLDSVVGEAIRRGAGELHRTPWNESVASPPDPDPTIYVPISAGEPSPGEAVNGDQQPKVRGQRFSHLVELYEREYAIPAERRDGKKVKGMASWKKHRCIIATWFVPFFKDRLLTMIEWSDLRDLRGLMLDTPAIITRSPNAEERKTKPRSIADVNRTMSVLRRMFNVAVRKKWMLANPFNEGDTLIQIAAETPRSRVASYDEEDALLAACSTDRLRELKLCIMIGLDTGMREGAVAGLRWPDVFFADREDWVTNDAGDVVACGTLRFVSETSKTDDEMFLGMSLRLREALLDQRKIVAKRIADKELPGEWDRVLTTLEFPRKKWEEVLRALDLRYDLKFHDLRHTTGTRLSMEGMSIQMVARLLGHKQLTTAYRYQNATQDLLHAAGANLVASRKKFEEKRRKRVRAA
jgi:integrase